MGQVGIQGDPGPGTPPPQLLRPQNLAFLGLVLFFCFIYLFIFDLASLSILCPFFVILYYFSQFKFKIFPHFARYIISQLMQIKSGRLAENNHGPGKRA